MFMLLLEGNLINLRDWALPDLPKFREWMQPEHEWHKYDGPYYPQATPEEIEQMVARRRQAILNNSFPSPRRNLAIVDRETDMLIGMVSWYWQGEETNWLSVGICIYNPLYWGQGRGYEALGLWCEYLLSANPALVRLDLRTWSGNVRMMRLAEKLGYQQEARFRKARIVNGKYYDGMGYGILREEWQERYPKGFAAHLSKRKPMR